MKKRTTILFFFVMISVSLFSQNQKKEELAENKQVEIIRDRLMVDVFHAFWLGMPQEVNSMKFNPGFNVSILWDFKNYQKRPVSFGLGLGVTYYTLFSDAILKYDNTSKLMKYYVLPFSQDSVIKLNRSTYISCNLPLEFRYRHQNGVKLTIGVRIGLVAEISHRYKGANPNGDGTSLNFKNYDIQNKQKFNFDTYFRVGWKYVSLYYSYQITSLFDKNKGPHITPMALGVTWNIF